MFWITFITVWYESPSDNYTFLKAFSFLPLHILAIIINTADIYSTYSSNDDSNYIELLRTSKGILSSILVP